MLYGEIDYQALDDICNELRVIIFSWYLLCDRSLVLKNSQMAMS